MTSACRVTPSQRLGHLLVGPNAPHDENSLLIVARDLIETSPILFLDEFQLPDRAALERLLLAAQLDLYGNCQRCRNTQDDGEEAWTESSFCGIPYVRKAVKGAMLRCLVGVVVVVLAEGWPCGYNLLRVHRRRFSSRSSTCSIGGLTSMFA